MMNIAFTRRVSRAVALAAAVAGGALALAAPASAATETFGGTVPHGGYVEAPARAYDDATCSIDNDGYVGCVALYTTGTAFSSSYGFGVVSASWGTNVSTPLVLRVYNFSGATATVSGVANY